MFDDIDFDNIEETEVDLNNSELENSTIGFSYQANMVDSLDTSSSSHEVESDFDSASINSS